MVKVTATVLTIVANRCQDIEVVITDGTISLPFPIHPRTAGWFS